MFLGNLDYIEALSLFPENGLRSVTRVLALTLCSAPPPVSPLGASPKKIDTRAKSNELSAPFKKHKITLYTIYAMWYLSMVEWGHFGEDRTMNYKSEKDHFVLCWVVVYQSLWCLIGSIPGFDKGELATTTKKTVLGHSTA